MNQPIKTLLVEDDEVDVEAIIRAFERQKIDTAFTIVGNGLEALTLMRSEYKDESLVWPYLILLDLNMPRMNGIEFLQTMRQDPQLCRSIVFVLTTSDRNEDKMAAYDAHVAGYFVKSQLGKDHLPVTKLLELYWQLVEFPPV